MDFSIAALLAQDGITNGAIYALLALALVLVFTVTRVILIPSGEFVVYGTLTLAGFQLGKPPGTIGLVIAMAVIAGVMEGVACVRRRRVRAHSAAARAVDRACPVAIAALAAWLAPSEAPVLGADRADAGAGHGAGAAALPDRLSAGGGGDRAGAAHRRRSPCISS